MASSDNPFAALLGKSKSGIDKLLIEEIFLFTLKKDQSSPSTTNSRKKALLCLADVIVTDSGTDTEMGEELLAHAIFERLMLTDTKQYLIAGTETDDTLQSDGLLYLHRAFIVCEQAKQAFPQRKDDCEKIGSLIITNATTCMRQPDLFPGRTVWEQWKQIFEMFEDIDATNTMEFLAQCVQKIYADDEALAALGALKANFYPLLGKIQTDISQSNLITIKKNIFYLLSFFVRDKRIPQMGEVLIDYTMPNPNTNGK